MKKRIILTAFTVLWCMSSGSLAHAQSNQSNLHHVKQQLQKNQNMIHQKESEKLAINEKVQHIQDDLQSLHIEILKNKEQIAGIEQKVKTTENQIEQKKEEIVQLEGQVAARKQIMKKRLISLQHDDKTKMFMDAILNSESFADLIGRISAVATFMNADKDILATQKKDLQQIEKDKSIIDHQEKILRDEGKRLASQQADLGANIEKRQANLVKMEASLAHIEKQLTIAGKEKTNMESQMKNIQANIEREQKEAKSARTVNSIVESSPPGNIKGTVLYVTATAYSYQDTNGTISRLGYNIKDDPTLKLIAVDPSVIPLGKKVWVEGYGVAIAGDTGGAINGYTIDVLMHSKAQALAWGRRTVKVIILN